MQRVRTIYPANPSDPMGYVDCHHFSHFPALEAYTLRPLRTVVPANMSPNRCRFLEASTAIAAGRAPSNSGLTSMSLASVRTPACSHEHRPPSTRRTHSPKIILPGELPTSASNRKKYPRYTATHAVTPSTTWLFGIAPATTIPITKPIRLSNTNAKSGPCSHPQEQPQCCKAVRSAALQEADRPGGYPRR